jgi:hypothetical protein
MNEAFDPKNELEQRLIDGQEGRMSEAEFMEALMESQVVMPVLDKRQIEGLQSSTRAQPLTLETEDGSHVVAVFSSPDRAKPFVRDFPGYEGGILEKFGWVAEKVGAGYGIATNPGWEVGLDLEADVIGRLGAHRENA